MAQDAQDTRMGRSAGQGRLLARPASTPVLPGDLSIGEVTTLDLGDRLRNPLLYVPAGHRQGQAMPLALMLHGAGGSADHGMDLLRTEADATKMILLAPSSRGRTWDVILGQYGPDVQRIDRALTAVFERLTVDPGRIAVGGFSDGASYALSLGLTNGDLFRHVIAFSPGFMVPAARHGKPRFFVSHGTRDAVLPIESCSRRLHPALQHAGYPVKYEEFEGPHRVPARIAHQAAQWFLEREQTP